MVSLDIQLLVPKPPKILHKSETDKSRLEFSLVYMESDVMFFIYGPYIGMFFCQILFKKKES